MPADQQTPQTTQEALIIDVLAKLGPTKTRALLPKLSNNGATFQKSDLNRMLYRLRDRGMVQQDSNYQWHVSDFKHASRKISKASSPTEELSERTQGTNREAQDPMATIDFNPTSDQKRMIEFAPSGHLLIRGEAGSGKTTVLAARAGHLLGGLLEGRLLFLVYNAALAEYVRKLLVSFNCSKDVDVYTIHSWANHFYEHIVGQRPRLVNAAEKKQIVLAAKREAGSRWSQSHLNNAVDEFWFDEISWLIGQGVQNLEKYREI